MRRLRKEPLVVLFLIAAISLWFVYQKESTQQKEAPQENTVDPVDETPLVIQIIIPLSGPSAVMGTSAQKGIDVAVEEIKDTGGVHGQTVQVQFGDGACTAAGTKRAMRGTSPVIITGCDTETVAAGLLNPKMTIVGIAASSPDIREVGDNVFSVWPSDDLQGKLLAEYMIAIGVNRTTLLFMDSDYALVVKNRFKETYIRLGGLIEDEIIYNNKTLIPDATSLFIAADNDEVLSTVQEYKGPIFSTETLGHHRGVIYVNYTFTNTTTAQGFIHAYQKRYGTVPDLVAANAYDAIMLVAEALRKNATAKGINEYLTSVKAWQGAGGSLTIDHHEAIRPLAIMNGTEAI